MVIPDPLRWIGPLALWALAVACAGPSQIDVSGIAEQAPLPYSVLVSGGGFVEEPAPPVELGPLARTFEAGGDGESLTLDQIVGALRSGRVFTRVVEDGASDRETRARVARMRTGLSLEDPGVRGLLEAARRDGHDYLIVVQRLIDGPVEEFGINDRWPLTVSLWLLVGLGMFIPDHTYESRATLQAGVYEVHTGRLVHRTAGGAGPAELSLVGRGNAWGLLLSIVVPPFWVGSNDDTLLAEMRRVTAQRLVGSLARQLKSPACRQDLVETARAMVTVVRGDEGVGIDIRAEEAIGSIALRIDGRPLDGPAAEAFRLALVDSARVTPDGAFRQAAVLRGTPPRGLLQILVRSVAGGVASVTVDLEEL